MAVTAKSPELQRIVVAGGQIGDDALELAAGAAPKVAGLELIEDGDTFTPIKEGFFAQKFGTNVAYGFYVEAKGKNGKVTTKPWYLGSVAKAFRLVDPTTKQPTDEWAYSDGDVYDLSLKCASVKEFALQLIGKKIKVKVEKKLGLRRNFRTDQDEVKEQSRFTHSFVK